MLLLILLPLLAVDGAWSPFSGSARRKLATASAGHSRVLAAGDVMTNSVNSSFTAGNVLVSLVASSSTSTSRVTCVSAAAFSFA